MRALEVVELTGRPFAASAPVIGAAPRWDTLIVGLDWETTILDERLAARTDAMFDGGLVDEVRALLDAGLRDGTTASRALGYAQVLAAIDAGADDDERAKPGLDIHRHPSLRAPAALLVPARPPHHLARRCGARQRDRGRLGVAARILIWWNSPKGTERRRLRRPARPACPIDADAGRGRGAVRSAARTRRRRRVAGRRRAARDAGVFDLCPRGSADDWFMDYRNADGSVAQMCGNGVRVFAHYLRAAGLERRDEFVVGSLAGPRPVVGHSADALTADIGVDMGKANQFGTGEATVGGRRFSECTTTGRGPASDPTTNSVRRSRPLARR